MVSVMLALMLPVPAPLADLRVESARSAFRQCIAMQAGEIVTAARSDASSAVEISPSSAADAARHFCYVLEKDIRGVLPAFIENMLKKEGVTSFSQSTVDMLSDDTLTAMIDEEVELLKAALLSNPET
jgi:hypothetical protein